ncbi:Uncharacterised protein [Mycobacteroides abscessus subsp. abscessus]|nr:Uncharacterised protein [Mycobacteroides abscessus subsp. abscessus]
MENDSANDTPGTDRKHLDVYFGQSSAKADAIIWLGAAPSGLWTEAQWARAADLFRCFATENVVLHGSS